MHPGISPTAAPTETEAVALKHLKLLNRDMERISTQANSFAGRFLFGGIVAVVALINTDLLLAQRLAAGLHYLWLVPILVLLVLALSGWYFHMVAVRIQLLKREYRRAIHRYEVTLYALLLHASEKHYLVHLGVALENAELSGAALGRDVNFPDAMAYLHSHHKRIYDRIEWKRDWWMAMTIVTLAIAIKLGLYALA